MKKKPLSSIWLWCLETLLCLLCALLPALAMLRASGDAPLALAMIWLYGVYPVASFILPLLAAKRSVNALAAALPPFAVYVPLWLLAGLNLPALPTLLSLLLGIVGANAGAEMLKRRKKER